jgi:very-short-patch-repair endonuclease
MIKRFMAKLLGAEKYPIYYGAKPQGLRLAGDLRHNMTPAEKLLWKHLRNRKMEGYRFRRQHPIEEFIVDFFCYDANLAIELDGGSHLDASQIERDEERTKILNSHGLKVLRFRNEELEYNMEGVILKIIKELIELKKLDL